MTTLINPGNGPGRLVHRFEPGELFRIRLVGISMEPDYHDGEYVELNVVNVADAECVLGRDCMFRRKDGRATFKRLHRIMPDGTLRLRALNRDAFPDLLEVRPDELELLAFARFIVLPVPIVKTTQQKSGATRAELSQAVAAIDRMPGIRSKMPAAIVQRLDLFHRQPDFLRVSGMRKIIAAHKAIPAQKKSGTPRTSKSCAACKAAQPASKSSKRKSFATAA